jgi:hypothetical protein
LGGGQFGDIANTPIDGGMQQWTQLPSMEWIIGNSKKKGIFPKEPAVGTGGGKKEAEKAVGNMAAELGEECIIDLFDKDKSKDKNPQKGRPPVYKLTRPGLLQF